MQTNTKLLTWGLFLQQAVDLHSLNPEALFNLAAHPVWSLVSSSIYLKAFFYKHYILNKYFKIHCAHQAQAREGTLLLTILHFSEKENY